MWLAKERKNMNWSHKLGIYIFILNDNLLRITMHIVFFGLW